ARRPRGGSCAGRSAAAGGASTTSRSWSTARRRSTRTSPSTSSGSTMARTPSSAAFALALLAGAAAAQHQEPAKSIAVPSIAAAALPATGSVAGPAVSGDVNTNIGETTLNASVKLALPVGLGAELAVQSAQPTSGAGALFDNGDSIASGAQVSLAIAYANYDLLPDNDPGVVKFEQ